MKATSKCQTCFLPWPCLKDLGLLLDFWCFLLFFPRFDRPCPCDFATSSKNISSSSYNWENIMNMGKPLLRISTGGTWRCLLIGLKPPNSGWGKLGKLSLDCLWDGRLKTVDGGPGLCTGVDPGRNDGMENCIEMSNKNTYFVLIIWLNIGLAKKKATSAWTWNSDSNVSIGGNFAV